MAEYLSCYSNKTESVSLRKCPHDHWLTNKAYLSVITVTNISKSFTYRMAAKNNWHRHTPHTHPFNGPFFRTTQVSRYQKGKTNLDFTEARDSEWQWHQLGHMQVCISLRTYNHASTPLLSCLQAGCPSCHPSNSVKALKAFKALKDTDTHCCAN